MNKYILLLLMSLAVFQSQAEVLYISDTLVINLRTGPGNEYRIIKGLKSGIRLEVLEADEGSGFTHVSVSAELQGYVPTRFLQKETIYKERFILVERELNKAKNELLGLKSSSKELHSDKGSLEKQSKDLISSNAQLEKELKHIKSISSSAVSIDNRNKELVQQNEELKIKTDTLNAENERLAALLDDRYFWYGIGLLGTGITLGLILPLFGNRKKGGWA